MVVLINAISIKEGGSLVVLKSLLENFLKLRADIEWHVAVDAGLVDAEFLRHARVKTWSLGAVRRNSLAIRFWYETGLPRLMRRIGADAVFSLTNYLPVTRHLPSLLLVQHAGHFSSYFDACQVREYPRLSQRLAWWMKKGWVRRSLERATLVTVQTQALAQDIAQQQCVERTKIWVIPHGPGLLEVGSPKRLRVNSPWRIGYITKYGVQKNFTPLFEAVASLRQAGRDVCLVLTLDPGTPHVSKLLAQARQLGIEPWIENHGEVEQGGIRDLYDSLDLFVFPSLCESFGFPMLEALSRGLPLLVADTPGNQEIAGEDSLFFGAGDAVGLADKIVALMTDATRYAAASQASLARAGDFSWRKAAQATLDLLVEVVDGKSGGTHGC